MNTSLQASLLAIALVLSGCGNNESSRHCVTWNYAALGLTAYSEIDEFNVLRAVNSHVYWNNDGQFMIWHNGEFLSGPVEQSLYDFLGARSSGHSDLLSAVGAEGWEAFAIDVHRPSTNVVSTDFFLKKCVG